MQDESEHEEQYIEKMEVKDFDEGLGKQGTNCVFSPRITTY